MVNRLFYFATPMIGGRRGGVFDADEALDLIAQHRVTTSFMAPTLLMRLVEAQVRRPRDVSSLRALLLGAAPCPHSLKERAEAASRDNEVATEDKGVLSKKILCWSIADRTTSMRNL